MARAKSRRRQKGSGQLKRRGNIWWISYHVLGERVWESTGKTEREQAEAVLAERLGEVAAGEDPTPSKVTVGELCELVLADYRLRNVKGLKVEEWRYRAHVEPIFAKLRAQNFGSAQVRLYVERRRKEGAGEATINRELSLVRRGFKLGSREEPPLVRRVPYIAQLEEDNVRQGFLDPDQYHRLLEKLPERLQALFVCAYHVGTRKGELRKIQWPQVDFEERRIYLAARQTKGNEARGLPIYGEMEFWLRRQWERKPENCPWVFYSRSMPVGAHLVGWKEACARAGVAGLLFHDLRRSAVRNMSKAGVRESVAMKVSGHKTQSMYRRYNIVNDQDLDDVGAQMEQYFGEQRAKKRLERIK